MFTFVIKIFIEFIELFTYICYFHKINWGPGKTLAVKSFNLKERILNIRNSCSLEILNV